MQVTEAPLHGIVVIGDWPLTDNGKIDRPGLADTGLADTGLADTGRRAPRTRRSHRR